jgi:hypothetical protein
MKSYSCLLGFIYQFEFHRSSHRQDFFRKWANYFSSLPIRAALRFKTPNVFASGTLGSWVRIALEVWIYTYICVFSVFILSCVGNDVAVGWSPVQRVLQTVCKIKSFRLIVKWEQVRGSNPSRKARIRIRRTNHYFSLDETSNIFNIISVFAQNNNLVALSVHKLVIFFTKHNSSKFSGR